VQQSQRVVDLRYLLELVWVDIVFVLSGEVGQLVLKELSV
jgi:hypothetical protein